MHKMKITITLLFLLHSSLALAAPIVCTQDQDNSSVLIKMDVPHPKHALVYRPDKTTVWIQTSPDFVHKQMDKFEDITNWEFTKDSEGTVWVDGKATIQKIISGKGVYHLYIADNLETEPENTYYIECYFTIN